MAKVVPNPNTGKKPTYVSLRDKKPGDILVVGVFSGSRMVKNNLHDDANPRSKAEVPLHEFVTDGGDIVCLNSAGQLDFLLGKKEPGTQLAITYEGKEGFTDKSTGKPSKFKAHKFHIEELE